MTDVKPVSPVARLIGCHGNTSRSLKWRSNPLPICARCTGLLLGYLAAVPVEVLGLCAGWLVPLLLLQPMAVDGLTQLMRVRQSTNWLRFLTGLLGGSGQIILCVRVMQYMFRVLL